MARVSSQHIPGKGDLNHQFSAASLERMLAIYRKHAGDYRFGALTAEFFGLDAREQAAWFKEAEAYPARMREMIQQAVVFALTHKDEAGKASPLPVTFAWTTGKLRGVRVTYETGDAAGVRVEIGGVPGPLTSSLERRRNAKRLGARHA